MDRIQRDVPTSVTITDPQFFEQALRRFVKNTRPIIIDIKRRQYFSSKPTHNARRRKGQRLERSRQRREEERRRQH